VELPKKHGRGGQSSVRFARLRLEKRHNYLRKVAEGCTQHFINQSESVPNVSGLILAGLADFKNDLFGSDMFDQRLKRIVLDVVDTCYGFENGFNQDIELSAERLKDVIFIKEKKLVSRFFDQIAQDTGRYCFGIRDCLYACEGGAVETLIVFENLETERIVISTAEGPKILYLSPEQSEKQENFGKDAKTGQDNEVLERMPLVEWIAENYKKFGCSLNFVTDRSQEGMQFVKGFGGIGALLRYKLDFNTLDEEEQTKEEDEEYDFFY
jgi:peptide chain release factor subunit 1